MTQIFSSTTENKKNLLEKRKSHFKFASFFLVRVESGQRNGAPINLNGGDTMYTNLANLQQTMLLQQRMFLQALCQQNSLVKNVNQSATTAPNAATIAGTTSAGVNNDAAKKHFIAPSLSQYRFVSGQQVSTKFRLHIYSFSREVEAATSSN